MLSGAGKDKPQRSVCIRHLRIVNWHIGSEIILIQINERNRNTTSQPAGWLFFLEVISLDFHPASLVFW